MIQTNQTRLIFPEENNLRLLFGQEDLNIGDPFVVDQIQNLFNGQGGSEEDEFFNLFRIKIKPYRLIDIRPDFGSSGADAKKGTQTFAQQSDKLAQLFSATTPEDLVSKNLIAPISVALPDLKPGFNDTLRTIVRDNTPITVNRKSRSQEQKKEILISLPLKSNFINIAYQHNWSETEDKFTDVSANALTTIVQGFGGISSSIESFKDDKGQGLRKAGSAISDLAKGGVGIAGELIKRQIYKGLSFLS